MHVRALAWNIEHFYSNSQMDRDFWSDCCLFCVSVTKVVKCSKKTPHLFPDTVPMIIRWQINSLGLSQLLAATLTCSNSRMFADNNYRLRFQSCLGDLGTQGSWQLWRSPPLGFAGALIDFCHQPNNPAGAGMQNSRNIYSENIFMSARQGIPLGHRLYKQQ